MKTLLNLDPRPTRPKTVSVIRWAGAGNQQRQLYRREPSMEGCHNSIQGMVYPHRPLRLIIAWFFLNSKAVSTIHFFRPSVGR